MSFASTKEIPGAPLFDGVSFAPKGRFWSKLGVSKYRTIWLKTAVFPIWPRAKMGDFGHPKRACFWPPKKGLYSVVRQPIHQQVKVTHQHSVFPCVGSSLKN